MRNNVDPKCRWCTGTGWVCENHPDRPWGGISTAVNACDCGAACFAPAWRPTVPNEPLDLDAIEARANAANFGPWKVYLNRQNDRAHHHVRAADGRWIVEQALGPCDVTRKDAEFIAAARTDIPALIAKVREQEREIARLRLDEHRLNWLDVHPRMVVVADRGERCFQWAARDVDGACIWLGGLRQAIDRAREIEATVAAEAGR